MKIQRFIDQDSRGAMAQARAALGPDAVILSNKRVGNQIELVAAVDLDAIALAGQAEAQSRQLETSANKPADAKDSERLESLQRQLSHLRALLEDRLADMSWQDMARRPSPKAALQARLSKLGLSRSFSGLLADQLPPQDDVERYWQSALTLLRSRLPVDSPDRWLDQGGVVALIGATGVGKTTTVAKLAARFVLRHGSESLGLITTDCYRIGGQEQLQTFADYLQVPMLVATNPQELQQALARMADKRLVLIDCPGMGQRDARLRDQAALLQSAPVPIQTCAVLPATAVLRAQREFIEALGADALAGIVVSKLDEAVDLGAIVEVAVETGLPISYVSDGQRVPDDLEPAQVQALIDLAVALMPEAARANNQSFSDVLHSSLAAHANTVK